MILDYAVLAIRIALLFPLILFIKEQIGRRNHDPQVNSVGDAITFMGVAMLLLDIVLIYGKGTMILSGVSGDFFTNLSLTFAEGLRLAAIMWAVKIFRTIK